MDDDLGACTGAEERGLTLVVAIGDDDVTNDAEIVELGVVMAVLTGFTKWMLVCDMVPKEENCPINPIVA